MSWQVDIQHHDLLIDVNKKMACGTSVQVKYINYHMLDQESHTV